MVGRFSRRTEKKEGIAESDSVHVDALLFKQVETDILLICSCIRIIFIHVSVKSQTTEF